MMPNGQPLLTEADIAKIFQSKATLNVSTKSYSNIAKDGVIPSTEAEREKATAEFYEWIEDNCRFLEEHVPQYHILNEHAEKEEKCIETFEKGDGDAYFQLLNAMDRTMVQIHDIIDEITGINQNLMSFYFHSTSAIRRYLEFVEKMEGEEKVTDETFEKFKIEDLPIDPEDGSPSAKFFARIKILEDDAQRSHSFTFVDQETFFQKHGPKFQQKGSGLMKWTFKN